MGAIMFKLQNPSRRSALLMTLAGVAPVAALAQSTYPNVPIRMLVGNPAGGTTDVVGRLIGVKLGQALKGSIIVDNKPGASGLIAADFVGKAAPDGYTLLMASSQLATYKALYASNPFDAERNLEPIGVVATSPYVMVVHPSMPVKTLPELLAYAKANPGKISYAGSAPGTAQHLGWELIKRSTGTDMQYVPYKGTGELMPDLLSGRLQAGIDNVAILTPYIKAGQLRGIAVTSAKPSSMLPDLPTVASSGVPDFEAIGWFMVLAPARTPAPVLEVLRQALRDVMASQDTRDKLIAIGADPQNGATDDARKLLHREITVWSKVIKDAGITAQ